MKTLVKTLLVLIFCGRIQKIQIGLLLCISVDITDCILQNQSKNTNESTVNGTKIQKMMLIVKFINLNFINELLAGDGCY